MNLHQANILIVDDDKDVLTAVRFLLKMEVKTILTETNPDNIHKLVTENDIDIILLDMNFRSSINTGNEGLFWLKEIKKRKPSLSVIMITAYADIDLAIKSLKEGAADFIVKPWHNEHLLNILSETLRKQATPDSKEKTNKRNTDKGTLFLDEIGNITLQQQAKLLTVLQNREVTRLGANTPMPVDIRLLSATNLPLRELANEAKFRKDLIYRINTVEITVPPLRERGEDIILLAKHFLKMYEKKYFKQKFRLGLTRGALYRRLEKHGL